MCEREGGMKRVCGRRERELSLSLSLIHTHTHLCRVEVLYASSLGKLHRSMSPNDEERRRRKSKKKKKKQSRKHHHTSSSSSSFSDSGSSSDHDKYKKRKHKDDLSSSYSSSDMEYNHRKHKKRRHHAQSSERERRHLPLSSKKSHRTRHVDQVAFSTHDTNGPSKPEEIVCTMLCKFPELANDLEQLLKMLDDGQAVDISGLANENIAAYLQQLFKALLLHKTTQGLYYLPDRASKKTLQILGPTLQTISQSQVEDPDKVDRLKHGEKESEPVANKDGLCGHEQPGPHEQKRRVLGPAMPSTEELAAAARLTETGPLLREAVEDPLMDTFIGPPPPAAVREAESANEAERYEEVERILAPDIGNAYELLGLKVGATAELMKKKYWKLSLLVHPDKCAHPQAHLAFTTLNQAFKDLQDPIKRSIIEQKIEEKETREEFEAELKAKREAAQWRKLRGESLPGDDALLETPKVLKRDEWMTELPPERKAGAPSQRATFFSRSTKSGRGDTSVWTDTPLEKAQKAKMEYLEAQQHAALTGDTNNFSFKEDNDAAAADILDHFNSARRGVSLLEKHQLEHSKKVKKASKEASQPAEWAGSHPWKPWDRDKDLAAGRKSVNLDKSNMAQGLSSRFSSTHTERSFL